MALDTDRIEAVTFDSFSTLVDVDSTATPVAFAREWHARAVTYGMVANYVDAYETYYDLHRDALEYLLAAEGVAVSDDELDEMVGAYHETEPFDDVRDGLDRLADAGYDVGIVSNGDPPMLESLVGVADISDALAATVSADEIERHKPAVELYEHAADRLDTEPSAVAHVSNGQFDVQGPCTRRCRASGSTDRARLSIRSAPTRTASSSPSTNSRPRCRRSGSALAPKRSSERCGPDI
jgi:2-haloacid dehalogenase